MRLLIIRTSAMGDVALTVPVIPEALDGLRISLQLAGALFEVTYCIRGSGCGPEKVNLNSAELAFTRGANPYRTGGAEIKMKELKSLLVKGTNRLTVHVG